MNPSRGVPGTHDPILEFEVQFILTPPFQVVSFYSTISTSASWVIDVVPYSEAANQHIPDARMSFCTLQRKLL